MERRFSLVHAIIAASVLAVPAAAQSPFGGGNPAAAPGREVPILGQLPLIGQLFRLPGDELAEQKQRLQQARDALAKTKELEKKGDATQEDVHAREVELRQAEAQLVAAERMLAWQGFVKQLDQPVEVELRNATLAQAVEALRQSSGVNINVGTRLPGDLRFNVLARQVPLSFVLEGLARQGNLMLAPPPGEDQRGIVLQNWPMLEINGKPEAFPGPLAPWSSDWTYLPTIRNANGFRPRSITSRPPTDGDAGTTIGKAINASGPLQLGVGGDLVVVAEPGAGPKGETGQWLTVYRLQGNTLKKVSTTFHQSVGAAAAAVSEMPVPAAGAIGAEIMRAPTWTERRKKLEDSRSRLDPEQYTRLKKFFDGRIAAEKAGKKAPTVD